MNCSKAQHEISNGLAAGASLLPLDLASHLDACPACQARYVSESRLLQSIDDELQAIVNQPVPDSLLAGVRFRIAASKAWTSGFPVWIPAAAAVLVGVMLAWTYSFIPGKKTDSAPTLANSVTKPAMAPEQSAPSVNVPQRVGIANADSIHRVHSQEVPSRNAVRATKHPAVLTDPREAQALMAFAAAVERRPELGAALLRPAVASASDHKEIQPIQIPELIVPVLPEEESE